MSECRHNNHGHVMLWFVILVGFGGAWNSCNTEFESTKREVDAVQRENRDLKQRIEQLEQRR